MTMLILDNPYLYTTKQCIKKINYKNNLYICLKKSVYVLCGVKLVVTAFTDNYLIVPSSGTQGLYTSNSRSIV